MRSTAIALLFTTSACDAQPARGVTPRATRDRAPDQHCTVTRIIDGDSFACGASRRVRLIGIDAPELSQPPYGAQSRDVLATLMPVGTVVRLEFDVDSADRYQRALAYVWRDDTMVNLAIVARGFALAERFPPNTRLQPQLDSAMNLARTAEIGLWNVGGFDCKPNDRRRKVC